MLPRPGPSWLATSAKADERVLIGPDIVIHVYRRRGRLDLRISAPDDMAIRREPEPDTTYSGRY